MINEKELIDRVIAKDSISEEAFFKLYHPRLLRASSYFLGGKDSEAEDIVQETFLVALPKLPQYVFKAPIYAWLRQICLRLCYARRRTRGRMVASPESEIEARQSAGRDQDELQNEAKRTAQKLELLRLLVSRLGPNSAEIIHMRNVNGLSYRQIGETLGLPQGTVMSRLARARQQLRKNLDQHRNRPSVRTQPAEAAQAPRRR